MRGHKHEHPDGRAGGTPRPEPRHAHGAHDAAHRHDPGGHGHEGHDHAPAVTVANARRVRLVLVLTAGFALVQAGAGWVSGSLALVADAGHMASDAAALLLALVACRLAARPPDAARTYGFQRARVLAALANGAALILLVAWIAWEAVRRLGEPVPVMAGPMLAVAVAGLLVSLVGAWLLAGGDRRDGNLRGAYLHVLGDLLGSVGAIAAALGILLTGWTPLDPILSVLVAAPVLRSARGLVTSSLSILLQAAPAGLDVRAAETDLATLPGVALAGHLHAWTLADQSAVATVHVVPASGADPLALPALVAARLRERHGIGHATVQVNRSDIVLPACGESPAR